MPLERARIDYLQSFVLEMRSDAFCYLIKVIGCWFHLGISYQVRIRRLKQDIMKKDVLDETIL